MKPNSKQNIFIWSIVLILMALEIPVVLWIQKSYENTEQDNKEPLIVKSLSEALGLSADQQNFFANTEKDYMGAIDTLGREISLDNKKIFNEIFPDNYKPEKANLLIEDAGKLKIEVDKIRFRYLKQLASVLNRSQSTEFQKILNESLVEWKDTLIIPQKQIFPTRPRKIY
jgi:hypothetical protein